eukprot:6178563-Pleurochrysis_carterae.AAC.2
MVGSVVLRAQSLRRQARGAAIACEAHIGCRPGCAGAGEDVRDSDCSGGRGGEYGGCGRGGAGGGSSGGAEAAAALAVAPAVQVV